MYSSSEEIREYLEYCAKKYDIFSHIEFNTEIKSASFDTEENLWLLETKQGVHRKTKFLMSGLGQLNSPEIPNIQGQEIFQGKTFHSAKWDHGFDMQDKEVAVIGNGGSAVQFVPDIGKKAKKLYIFQKSAHWAMERKDKPYSNVMKWIFKYIPLVLRLYRFRIWFLLGSNLRRIRQIFLQISKILNFCLL